GRKPRLQDLVIHPRQRHVAPEREPPPGPGHLAGLGARLERPHGPAVDRGEQFLALPPDLIQSGPSAEAAQVAWREGVHIDLRLEVLPVLMALGLVIARGGAHQPPPEWCGEQRRPLWNGGEEVAIARGLATKRKRPAWPQHPRELRERLTEIGNVVQ